MTLVTPCYPGYGRRFAPDIGLGVKTASTSILALSFTLETTVAKQTWVPIYGHATVVGSVVTHIPTMASRARSDTPSADAAPVQSPHTILRSDLEFDQGTITWEARLGDAEARVQLMLPAEPLAANSSADLSKSDVVNTDLSVGLNVLGAPYGFAFWNGAWEGVAGSQSTELKVYRLEYPL